MPITNVVITYLLLISITAIVISVVHLISKGNSLNIILYTMALLVSGLLFDIVSGQNLIKNLQPQLFNDKIIQISVLDLL